MHGANAAHRVSRVHRANAAHAAGLKILPYFYIYGTTDAAVTSEISIFNSMMTSIGGDGVVYERDLGPDSAKAASALKGKKPDSSWQAVN